MCGKSDERMGIDNSTMLFTLVSSWVRINLGIADACSIVKANVSSLTPRLSVYKAEDCRCIQLPLAVLMDIWPAF